MACPEFLSRKTVNLPTAVGDCIEAQLEKEKWIAAIALKLFVSRTTVNNHVQRILKKLGAHTRLEAVRRAEQARLI